MARWALFLAGPLAWGAHFLALYVVASISALAAQRTTFPARAIIIGLTVLALAALAGAAWRTLRAPGADALPAFERAVALAGLVLGAIAIIWQMLPALAL